MPKDNKNPGSLKFPKVPNHNPDENPKVPNDNPDGIARTSDRAVMKGEKVIDRMILTNVSETTPVGKLSDGTIIVVNEKVKNSEVSDYLRDLKIKEAPNVPEHDPSSSEQPLADTKPFKQVMPRRSSNISPQKQNSNAAKQPLPSQSLLAAYAAFAANKELKKALDIMTASEKRFRQPRNLKATAMRINLLKRLKAIRKSRGR